MQAKSQCKPSSREMSSFEKLNPGIKPRFFNQKMEQKLPLKKMPSTAANATMRSANEPFSIQFSAQSAFFFTQSRVSMALNSWSFSSLSLM